MEIIDEIIHATHINQIIDMTDFEVDCRRLVKQIHPDICKDPRAHEAFVKFQELKSSYEEGFKYLDDNGQVIIKDNTITLKGDMDRIMFSSAMGNNLIKYGSKNFVNSYLPLQINGPVIYTNGNFTVLLDITLPEEHVRWILNRLLEFASYMEKNGLVHAGLNLESCIFNPITHGLNVISFYHTRPIGSKLTTLSAKYKRFYPARTFHSKIADTAIDIALAKGIACTLLGDSSGRGIKLKGKVSEPLLNFIFTNHDSAYVAMTDYKEMLKNNYESKFYTLKL